MREVVVGDKFLMGRRSIADGVPTAGECEVTEVRHSGYMVVHSFYSGWTYTDPVDAYDPTQGWVHVRAYPPCLQVPEGL